MNKKELLDKFTLINRNTKRARGMIASYEYSQRDGNSIYNAYEKPSSEKKMRLPIVKNCFQNAKAKTQK